MMLIKKLTFYKTTRHYEPVDLFRDSDNRIMYKISPGLLGKVNSIVLGEIYHSYKSLSYNQSSKFLDKT